MGNLVVMPRARRQFVGGFVYHVLNRANGRLRIFRKRSDFEAFERVLAGKIYEQWGLTPLITSFNYLVHGEGMRVAGYLASKRTEDFEL